MLEGSGIQGSGAAEASSDTAASVEAVKASLASSRWRRRVTLTAGLIALIAAGVVLPPLFNIGRYQRRVAILMTQSLGRPVHMSSVELRLLPRPGFVLHDLSVSEDPEFGAEPILSARTVVASVRLLSLWRGKLAIDRVSVDEASLNLVQSAQGRWNLESLIMGAQPALTGRDANGPGNSNTTSVRTAVHFPYLEATDSRVNVKRGLEKSPFSLVSADLSLWQDTPGEWRVRLRGQPVRTDMEMSLADTGEVQMEASLHGANQLRDMPLKLQMEWRDAQLGQLSRLLLGSDAGWRGDLTADIEVQGTVDNAQTRARLRATGVRRQEFAPETPLDFDANCGFDFRHSQNALHDLECDTKIGDGQIHLKADLPGNSGKPSAVLEVHHVPLQAGLDLLRTVRSGFAPGISVAGTANGNLSYGGSSDSEQGAPARKLPRQHGSGKPARDSKVTDFEAINLHGAITTDGARLKGGALKEPILLPPITWTPAVVRIPGADNGGTLFDTALGASFTVALGSATPDQQIGQPQNGPATPSSAQSPQLATVRLNLDTHGYDSEVKGMTETAKLRDLAYAFGLPRLDEADGFLGGTVEFDFTGAGPWIGNLDSLAGSSNNSTSTNPEAKVVPAAVFRKLQNRKPGSLAALETVPEIPLNQESFSASLVIRHAQWKAPYLALPVELPQATIKVTDSGIEFASDFSYGLAKESDKDAARVSTHPQGIKGSVVVNASTRCKSGVCPPTVQLRLGSSDAETVQGVLLGASEEKTLFSPLIDRMRPADRPKFPEMKVVVQADNLTIGPAAFQKPLVQLQFKANEVIIEDWEAGSLGGIVKGTGHMSWVSGKPEYDFDGGFSRLNAGLLSSIINTKWSGGAVSGSGKIQLSGLTAKELATSASGEIRFDWPHGVLLASAKASQEARAQEIRFDDWSGTVAIRGGKAQVGENTLVMGKQHASVEGEIPFGGPAKLTISGSKTGLASQSGESESPHAVK